MSEKIAKDIEAEAEVEVEKESSLSLDKPETPDATPSKETILSAESDSKSKSSQAEDPEPEHARKPSRNLPPYLYRALEEETLRQAARTRSTPSANLQKNASPPITEKDEDAISPVPRTETQSAPPGPSFSRRSSNLPEYYDSEPSSQPPKYFNAAKPFSPALPTITRSSTSSTPKPYAPATASAVNAVIAQPSAEWVEHDKKKRGFKGWLKDLKGDFARDPERDDHSAGTRQDRGSQPVANVFGVRVSAVKARERGRSGRSWN